MELDIHTRPVERPGGWQQTLRHKFGRDFALGYLLLIPLIIVLFVFLAYSNCDRRQYYLAGQSNRLAG